MAKRRDGISRRTTRENREARQENGGKAIQTPMKIRSELYREFGRDTANGLRMQGRRGVRARARLARMRQPHVSSNGNSPV